METMWLYGKEKERTGSEVWDSGKRRERDEGREDATGLGGEGVFGWVDEMKCTKWLER
jgi:hypothetical protein